MRKFIDNNIDVADRLGMFQPVLTTFKYEIIRVQGVLMEEEIPVGLEVIGKGLKQDETQGNVVFKMRHIIFSSILRLIVGYLFLITLFLTVIRESNVLGVFFDVLGKM